MDDARHRVARQITDPQRAISLPLASELAVVAAEIFVLPMAFGLVAYALVFSVVNAAMLAVRIRAETSSRLGRN